MKGLRIPLRLLAGLLFSSHLPLLAAEPELKPFTAEYSLSLGYLEFARVEVSLQISDDGAYQYRAHTLPVGVTAFFRSDEIIENSNGRISQGSIRPLNYHYQHDSSANPRRADLNFDWDRLRVTNTTANSRWSMKIAPDTQDKFSQQLRLMLSRSGGKQAIQFPVADGGRTKIYRFQQSREEWIETDAGGFLTLVMVRSKDNRPSRASLWLAPELNYLPVKVERTEKDGRFIMQLNSVSWDVSR